MARSIRTKAVLLACCCFVGLASPAQAATRIELTLNPDIDFAGNPPGVVSRSLTGTGELDFIGDIADQTLGLADLSSFVLDLTYTVNLVGGSSVFGTYHFTKADLSAFSVTFSGLTSTASHIVTNAVSPTSGTITAPVSFAVNRVGNAEGNDVAFYAYPNGVQTLIGNGSFDAALVPSVPEPATWLMLLAGFGAIGWTLRRQRSTAAAARRSFA